MAILLNDSIKVQGGKPVEDKRLNNGVPYTSVDQVNSLIIPTDRYISLEVLINDKIYWYKGGIEDQNLIEKLEGSTTVTVEDGYNGEYDITKFSDVQYNLSLADGKYWYQDGNSINYIEVVKAKEITDKISIAQFQYGFSHSSLKIDRFRYIIKQANNTQYNFSNTNGRWEMYATLNYVNSRDFRHHKVNPNATEINSIINSGTYTIQDYIIPNFPETDAKNGLIVNFKAHNQTSQTFYNQNGEVWNRTYINTNGWSNWIKSIKNYDKVTFDDIEITNDYYKSNSIPSNVYLKLITNNYGDNIGRQIVQLNKEENTYYQQNNSVLFLTNEIGLVNTSSNSSTIPNEKELILNHILEYGRSILLIKNNDNNVHNNIKTFIKVDGILSGNEDGSVMLNNGISVPYSKGTIVSDHNININTESGNTYFLKHPDNSNVTINLNNLKNLEIVSLKKCFSGGDVTFNSSNQIVMKGATSFNGADGSNAVVSIVDNKCYIDINNYE